MKTKWFRYHVDLYFEIRQHVEVSRRYVPTSGGSHLDSLDDSC